MAVVIHRREFGGPMVMFMIMAVVMSVIVIVIVRVVVVMSGHRICFLRFRGKNATKVAASRPGERGTFNQARS